jgi:hypothetical protein
MDVESIELLEWVIERLKRKGGCEEEIEAIEAVIKREKS